MIELLIGIGMFWVGYQIVKSTRPRPQVQTPRFAPILPRPIPPPPVQPILATIAKERQQALAKAESLVHRLELLQIQRQPNPEAFGLELDRQVASDAVRQYEAIKQLLEVSLKNQGCSALEIDALIAKIEAPLD